AMCIAGPAILERLLAATNRPVIYDFDDAIWLLNTSAVNRRFGWLKFPGETAAICRMSAQVVVGNRYLQDYARLHNDRVTVIPSSVDTESFRTQVNGVRKARIVIGWSGSSTSQTYLEMFAPLLRQLSRRPDVELRIPSDRQPELP